MTLADLVTEIKFEAQIENDTDWSNHVYRFISDEANDIALQTRDKFLHVSRHSLSSSDQDATSKLVRLPTNFLVLDKVEFSTATPVTWPLPSRDGVVPPPLVTAKPKCFEFYGNETETGGVYKSSLRLYPHPYTLIANENVFVSYWRQPFGEITPATTSTTTIYPFTWLGVLKKKVIQRIHTYHVGQRADRVQLLGASMQPVLQATEIKDKEDKAYDSPRNA